MIDKKVEGKVVEILSNNFYIELENKEIVLAKTRGKLKENVFVGDKVLLDFSYNTYSIISVKERKNFLIRPQVANIDNLVIFLSLDSPSPDYLLLDKELILCLSKNITPIICVNKIDKLEENKSLSEHIDYLIKVYKEELNIDLIFTSFVTKEGIYNLKEKLKGKTSALSGNSGVGKSSITSILANNSNVKIGDISSKNKKGKNTTRNIKIYDLGEDTYILDTPGFSEYELFDIEHKNLKKYYMEYNKYKCKYEDCSHVFEDLCIVKENVENGMLDKKRYERYKYIYLDLYEKYKMKYK